MVVFPRLEDHQLARLGDPELIDYVVAAREAGDEDAARLGLRIFAFGMEEVVRAFIRSRLASHGDAAVEEVAERTLEDAIRSIASLAGRTPEEARAFVFRIGRRRIADHLRRGRARTESLDDEVTGGTAAALGSEDGLAAAETTLVIDELIGELRGDHRAVVELNVLSGYSARETVELIRGRDVGDPDDSMSEQNVHKIASRFRRDLRSRLAPSARR